MDSILAVTITRPLNVISLQSIGIILLYSRILIKAYDKLLKHKAFRMLKEEINVSMQYYFLIGYVNRAIFSFINIYETFRTLSFSS